MTTKNLHVEAENDLINMLAAKCFQRGKLCLVTAVEGSIRSRVRAIDSRL